MWQNLEKVQKTRQQLVRVVHIFFFNSRAETHLFPEIFNFTGHKRNTFNGTSRVVIFKIEGWNLARPLSSLLSNDTSMYQNSQALSIKKIFKHLHLHMAVQFLRTTGEKKLEVKAWLKRCVFWLEGGYHFTRAMIPALGNESLTTNHCYPGHALAQCNRMLYLGVWQVPGLVRIN